MLTLPPGQINRTLRHHPGTVCVELDPPNPGCAHYVRSAFLLGVLGPSTSLSLPYRTGAPTHLCTANTMIT